MATLQSLSKRLRDEIGDFGRSFVYQTVGDGVTNRFLVPYSPIDGYSLIVTKEGTDISTTVEVEEESGYVIFDTVPASGAVLVFAGTYYRYFTNDEICRFIDEAFKQHTYNHADQIGRLYTYATLPGVEEYPVVVYAATLALYTLATDASFDIDITAPDGVMIPRSERYRQLINMVEDRKNQYKELCSQLGIGLYRIDVFQLRRKSFSTNRYIPIYLPQEVDDTSMPIRAILSMPNYGSGVIPSPIPVEDLVLYAGDSFTQTFQFQFDTTQYTWYAQIAQEPGMALTLGTFTITHVSGDNTKLTISMTSDQTEVLPPIGYWDLRAKNSSVPGFEQTFLAGVVYTTQSVSQ